MVAKPEQSFVDAHFFSAIYSRYSRTHQESKNMLIKKLLAPLINDKILQRTEHCYIATAAISESGLDMLMSKLSIKCKVDIVTGLDLPTSPGALRKAIDNYRERITLRLHTQNFFHPNVYAFDMEFRKRVAFVGSGNLTMGGTLKHEELFYRLDAEKQVEEIKSWFTWYFENGRTLNEKIVEEYELIYPAIKERLNASREEKKQFMERISTMV
jgi:HKD family nuclease